VDVISRKTIRRFARLHADAAGELIRWIQVARRATWRGLAEVRQTFPDADQVRNLLIFNIRHNVYRLIVKVDYRANLLMLKELLTHSQYDKGDWKKWAR
jgi:mRNA interferase HigB